MILDNMEMSFFQEVFSAGLKFEVLGNLPFEPLHVTPFYNEGYILDTVDGKKLLRICRGSEDFIINQIQLLQCFQQRGLTGLLYPLALSDGRSYAKYNEQCWFHVTPWPCLGKVYFSCIDHLKALIKLLTDFRRTTLEDGISYNFPDLHPNDLSVKYREMMGQIHSFELLARFRLHPTAFDRFFLTYSSEISRQADAAFKILEKIEYDNMLAHLSPENMIINKLTRHNLRISADGIGFCLSLNSIECDLPIIDLAILLLKSGRSNQWTVSWFKVLLKEYQTYYMIHETEFQVILSYLTFPWSFYRLVARYYYNRVDWPVRTFMAKMERLLEDEPKREKLLKCIK